MLALAVSVLAACAGEEAPAVDAEPPLSPVASELEASSEVVLERHTSEEGSLMFAGREYSPSCGVVDPAKVDPVPLGVATGMGADLAVHAIEGVDPAVLVALDLPCDLVEDQQWGTGIGVDAYFSDTGITPEANEAWCAVGLFPPDPAEGFDCPDR